MGLYIASTDPRIATADPATVVKGSIDHILPAVKPKTMVKAGGISGSVGPWECDAPWNAAPASYPTKYTGAEIARKDICETTYAPG